MVKSVGSLTEFEAELNSAGEKLIVVDFSATWCGPCKMIKPFFHGVYLSKFQQPLPDIGAENKLFALSLCEKYDGVVFIEIDVDDAQDVAAHCDVKCMPTFQFYKNGKKVQQGPFSQEKPGLGTGHLEQSFQNLIAKGPEQPEVQEFSGANKEKLEETIKSLI